MLPRRKEKPSALHPAVGGLTNELHSHQTQSLTFRLRASESLQLGLGPLQKDTWINAHWGHMACELTQVSSLMTGLNSQIYFHPALQFPPKGGGSSRSILQESSANMCSCKDLSTKQTLNPPHLNNLPIFFVFPFPSQMSFKL